jgi:thymidylate synthase
MAREGKLNMTYFIRSCDLVRYLRDDVYMACRLVQWVVDRLQLLRLEPIGLEPGMLTMHIVSLHCFAGDLSMMDPDGYHSDVRRAYDDGYDWS